MADFATRSRRPQSTPAVEPKPVNALGLNPDHPMGAGHSLRQRNDVRREGIFVVPAPRHLALCGAMLSQNPAGEAPPRPGTCV